MSCFKCLIETIYYTQCSLIFKLINKKCDQNTSLVVVYYTLFLLFSLCQEIVPPLLQPDKSPF